MSDWIIGCNNDRDVDKTFISTSPSRHKNATQTTPWGRKDNSWNRLIVVV